MSEEKKSSGGVGAVSLLGLLLVGLKLCGVIAWSWWWVTVPFWGGAAILLAFAFGVAVVSAIAAIIMVVIDKFKK